MAQVPTPPASRHGSETPDAESKQLPITDSTELLQSLDTLLERYLHLLDRHQKLQAELASSLSAGFLSLAQANYTCAPGRRFGGDYYDERMKATRKVALRPPTSLAADVKAPTGGMSPGENADQDRSERVFRIETVSHDDTDPIESTEKELSASSNVPTAETNSPPENDESAEPTDSRDATGSSQTKATGDSTSKHSQGKSRSSDPIRWYGILVPPSLRSAQKSFTGAVEGPLPELASVVVEMQVVEREVEQLRSAIGSVDG
ncbi:hypothetical protein BDV25DRAFT_158132 [Aspergillus avenaceus]|uniref:Vacuolar ATPase assembly protein VMA22 n=1 Tax=Aspergillus avenaceus TaxID=36643 RepID=A0A5N6TQY5_ASPAV|nr:hypothetical protein BDV25DRAFT_158132 [Aspergillus avenaceus]